MIDCSQYGELLDDWPKPNDRDVEGENEGYTLVGEFSYEEFEKFWVSAQKTGFMNWDDEYIDWDVLDGTQWEMVITSYDGSVKKIYGSNAYPESWNDLGEALKELTGIDILA